MGLWGCALAAFYQGGIRILDISGELLGDLYKQEERLAIFTAAQRWNNSQCANGMGSAALKDYIFYQI